MLEVSAARARSGLTQAQIAAKMGTTQSAVARLETERLPSLTTLKRYAEATGSRLVVKLEPLKKAAKSTRRRAPGNASGK